MPTPWQGESSINKISLNGEDHGIDVASTDFKLSEENGKVTAFTDELNLEAGQSRNFELTLTLK